MEVALDELAELGVAAVEPAYIRGYTAFDEDSFSESAAERLGRALRDRGLGVRAVSAHMDLSDGDAAAMLARRIDFAAGLGARILITNAGPAVARGVILDRLAGAVPRLEVAGIVLALENPGHGRDDLIGLGEQGAALVAALGSDRLRLNVDVGNLCTYAGGLEPGLSAALPAAVHAHLKDFAEDGPDWRFVPLGEGMVDWRAVAGAMGRLAPGLPVAVELPLRLHRPGRGDPVRMAEPLPLPTIREAIRRSLDVWAVAKGG
ncbi:sugar phosphate isomerase/epimerase [Rubellimicrobium roseum]|uniref:Sugar phosphate isomerase/epimerase n=2 Tax=Rubellimicrobium roseum TaxID=687525 RepID=A0A5C4NAQ8_9RHOB|nr:sugar phosphate isomerase/epimerase [Rubellimicrobium roseum]